MVFAHSYVQPRVHASAPLADYDVSGDDPLAAAFLDAKSATR